MQCSKCQRDAIVFQPYSGLHLCDQHIIADVEAKAKRRIRAHSWLKPGDHIAVLLSGDKSTSALLYFLKKLTVHRRDIRISAITTDNGTGAPSNTSQAKRIAKVLDTELLEVLLSEESKFGSESCTGKNPEIPSPPLFPPLRSTLLDRIAQRHGITKIARGLCLDDAAGMVLENIIRGDVGKLFSGSYCQSLLLQICPFISVTAAEVSLYADLCRCDNNRTLNPYQGNRLHNDMVTLLDCFTNNHPATKYALLNLGENLAVSRRGSQVSSIRVNGTGNIKEGAAMTTQHSVR